MRRRMRTTVFKYFSSLFVCLFVHCLFILCSSMIISHIISGGILKLNISSIISSYM